MSTPLESRQRAQSALPSLAVLALALAVFLVLTLRNLHLPGLYYDEALDLTPMLDLMGSGATPLLRDIGVGPLPVMLLDYMGSLGGYLTVPFIRLLGSGVEAARLQPIFFSCVTIVLAWALARRWFGPGVAAVTALLVAVNPSFIWFSRQGISVTSVMTVFAVGAALALDVWRVEGKGRRAALLALAGALLGIGLWAKVLFLRWLVAVLAMELVSLATRGVRLRRHPVSAAAPAPIASWLAPRRAAWVMLGGLAGAAPLVYYNVAGLLRDGAAPTVALLLGSLVNPTQQFGVDNRDLWTNLGKALDDVRVFVDGSYFWYNGIPFSNVYAVPTLLVAIAAGTAFAVFGRRAGDGAVRFLQVLAALGVLTFMGAFTVSGLWATHQFIMVPWLQMIVACAAVWLAQTAVRAIGRQVGQVGGSSGRQVWVASVVVALLLALPVSRDVWVSEQHHATLARTGGSGRFSDAVYKIAAHFDERRVAQPVALDWGIEKQVRVLTADRVRPVEIFGYSAEPGDEFRRRAAEFLADPDREYIVLWDRFAVYNRRGAFTELAERMGKTVSETFIAHEKSGLPVYVVLKAN